MTIAPAESIDAQPQPPDMVWVAGASFVMGSDNHYPEEAPAHEVSVDGFWIDATPVTNAQFQRFVATTGHVTVAEQTPNAADYPGAKPELLVPASAVFRRPAAAGRSDATTTTGGPTSPARTGGIRAGRRARSTVWTTTRWSTSPTRTRPPTHAGRARSCRPRPSGRWRRAVAWRREYAWGDRPAPRRATHGEHVARRVSHREPAVRRVRDDIAGAATSRPTGSASTT